MERGTPPEAHRISQSNPLFSPPTPAVVTAVVLEGWETCAIDNAVSQQSHPLMDLTDVDVNKVLNQHPVGSVPHVPQNVSVSDLSTP